MNTQKETLFQEALCHIAGGVNSPVRAFRSVGGTPPFIDHATGAYVFDSTGKRYIDYVGSWGPAILGHSHPEVIAAVKTAAERGLSFGAPTEGETALAVEIKHFFPSIEKMRFVSSGTEACMSALRLARGFTGRDLIIKFEGHYHGHSDMLLAKAGSGVATCGLPDSAGVPQGTARDTLVLPFNDLAALKETFRCYPTAIAAVIIEPIMGNAGFIRPHCGYLEELRVLCSEAGTLLIFDEVMTGFRVAAGGVQSLLDIRPDLTILGKIVGGGLPLAVYGGREEIMHCLAPLGPVYQAGTLSGNPLAVAAGLTTLRLLRQDGFYAVLQSKTSALVEGLKEAAAAAAVPVVIDYEGGMFGLYFYDKPISNFNDAKKASTERYARYFHAMLKNGIYLAPSPFEAAFVSAAHRDIDIANTIEAATQIMLTFN